MNDLEYRTTGIFTAFFPNTPAGEEAWRSLANETQGTGKVFTIHLKSVLAQLRKAGYSVGKAKKSTLTMNDIFKEMEELGI